ncbi:MAG: GumC family protein [Polyangiales bacterium]
MSRNNDEIDDETGKKRHGSPIELRRVFWSLWRKKLILIVAALVAAGIGFATGKFAIKPNYEASATLRYDGFAGQNPMDIQRDLPSLTAVAYSESLLRTLRVAAGLDANIDMMRALANVHSDPGTGLVTFTAYGGTAEDAANLANTFVDTFMEHHRARRERELGTSVQSFDQRIEAASEELQLARDAYDAFREANGITNLSDEQEGVMTQAAEMRSQADIKMTELQALEARVTQLEGELERTPQTTVTTSSMSRQTSRLGELRQRLREARGQGLGEAHPQVQSLRRQVEALTEAGGDEPATTGSRANPAYESISRNLSTARTNLEAIRQEQAALEALAVTAQARANQFSTIEGQAATLLSQVNVKTALVEDLTLQRSAAQDQMEDIPTGFRRLATALPPENPVRSKKKMIVAVAIPTMVVAFLCIFFVFRDLWGLKLRFPNEVAWWGKGPVLGMSKWPFDPVGLTDVIADMEDMTDGAVGNVLIVGTSERDQDVVQRVAFGLSAAWAQVPTDFPDAHSDPMQNSSFVATPIVRTGVQSNAPLALPSGNSEIIHTPANADMTAPLADDATIAGMYLHDLAPGITADQVQQMLNEQLVASTYSDEGGTGLRRASRSADAVIVVVIADEVKATELAKMPTLLGRERGVAYLLLGVSDEAAKMPDRVGPNDDFWEPLLK